jgi:hypothetical protein
MLGPDLRLESDSHPLHAHRILKIGKEFSLPMGPMARRFPRKKMLPLLRIYKEGGWRSNKRHSQSV